MQKVILLSGIGVFFFYKMPQFFSFNKNPVSILVSVEKPWLRDRPVKESIGRMKDGYVCVLCSEHIPPACPTKLPHHQETGEKVILAEIYGFLDAVNMLSPV